MEIEIQNINMEKDFLKAQLNPHFLFNTLNNLYSLTLKKDNQAPEVILNLSDMMSYTLYESNTEKVTLTKELEFIQNYFNLEKMRYPADKNIRLNISGDVDAKGLYIAPLLTFSCIENAFKYGLKTTEGSFIFLDIKVKDSLFIFSWRTMLNKLMMPGKSAELVWKTCKSVYSCYIPVNTNCK